MNAKQQAAAWDKSKYVAVAAAPGSGKSTTLSAAVEHEVDQSGQSDNIALITYTNAAADVMRQRLACEVGYVGTLHSYLLKLMRESRPGLQVIELKEADEILENVAKGLRYKGSKSALIEARQNFWNKPQKLGSYSEAERVVLSYVAELMRENKAEFDLILARGLRLIRSQAIPPMKFFIDEFQDSAAIDLAIYMAHPHGRLFIVGDPSQSIYQFRGANSKIFEEFFNDTMTSRHILDTNYRSTKEICLAANMLIEHNSSSIKFEMNSAGSTGPVPKAHICQDVYVHDMRVEELVRHALISGDVAVLCRTNDQADSLKAFLKNRGINEPKLQIGTIHWSKGQEFDAVILAHMDVNDDYSPTDEERCLFYVGMTRAKEQVHAVTSQHRHVEWKGMQHRRASPFLVEAGFRFSYPQNEARTPTSD